MNNTASPFMDNSNFDNFTETTTRRLKHPVITFFHLIDYTLQSKRVFNNLPVNIVCTTKAEYPYIYICTRCCSIAQTIHFIL